MVFSIRRFKLQKCRKELYDCSKLSKRIYYDLKVLFLQEESYEFLQIQSFIFYK